MRRRIALIAVFVVLVGCGDGGLVAAGRIARPPDPSGRSGGAEADADASGGTLSAAVQFGTPPSDIETAKDESGCTWHRPWAGEQYAEQSTWATMERDGVRYRLWYRLCDNGGFRAWTRDDITAGELGTLAADRVTRLLPSPSLGSAPPADRGVVNVAMWLWVERAMWRQVSATAWVPTPEGIVWATVTARPRRLVYVPGDGALGSGPVVCAGPGSVWTAHDGDDRSSSCMYTYRHSSAMSAHGAFRSGVHVEWEISWRSNVAAGGSLPPHTTSTARDIVVRDVQAIVVR